MLAKSIVNMQNTNQLNRLEYKFLKSDKVNRIGCLS